MEPAGCPVRARRCWSITALLRHLYHSKHRSRSSRVERGLAGKISPMSMFMMDRWKPSGQFRNRTAAAGSNSHSRSLIGSSECVSMRGHFPASGSFQLKL